MKKKSNKLYMLFERLLRVFFNLLDKFNQNEKSFYF